MATTEAKLLTRFVFHFSSSHGPGRIEARMLPEDNENELEVLARACKEVLESNPDAKGWRIASAVRLDDSEDGN